MWTALKDTDQDPTTPATSSSSTPADRSPRATTAAAPGSGTASTSAPSRAAASPPAPDPAPTCTTCAPRTSRQRHPRQQGLRQRRLGRVRLHRLLDRQRLLRAARRGQGRRGADALLHGGALQGDDGFSDLELSTVSAPRSPASATSTSCSRGTPRTRSTPSRCAATTASTPSGRATGTRSSTTRSGRPRSELRLRAQPPEPWLCGGTTGPSDGCTTTKPAPWKAYWNASPVPPRSRERMFIELTTCGCRPADQQTAALMST